VVCDITGGLFYTIVGFVWITLGNDYYKRLCARPPPVLARVSHFQEGCVLDSAKHTLRLWRTVSAVPFLPPLCGGHICYSAIMAGVDRFGDAFGHFGTTSVRDRFVRNWIAMYNPMYGGNYSQRVQPTKERGRVLAAFFFFSVGVDASHCSPLTLDHCYKSLGNKMFILLVAHPVSVQVMPR